MLLKSFLLLMAMQDDHGTVPAEGGGDHAADAAHGMEHAEVIDVSNWLPAVTALVVFLFALGILYVKVWPLIIKGLDEREKKIRDTLAEADAAKEEAQAALAEYQENLAEARKEAGEMIAKAKADAKAAGEELKRKNEAELSDMKQRATREIESAKQTALTELHAEASALAAAIAGKILEREISADDQQRLVDETLSEMGRMQEA